MLFLQALLIGLSIAAPVGPASEGDRLADQR